MGHKVRARRRGIEYRVPMCSTSAGNSRTRIEAFEVYTHPASCDQLTSPIPLRLKRKPGETRLVTLQAPPHCPGEAFGV